MINFAFLKRNIPLFLLGCYYIFQTLYIAELPKKLKPYKIYCEKCKLPYAINYTFFFVFKFIK